MLGDDVGDDAVAIAQPDERADFGDGGHLVAAGRSRHEAEVHETPEHRGRRDVEHRRDPARRPVLLVADELAHLFALQSGIGAALRETLEDRLELVGDGRPRFAHGLLGHQERRSEPVGLALAADTVVGVRVDGTAVDGLRDAAEAVADPVAHLVGDREAVATERRIVARRLVCVEHDRPLLREQDARVLEIPRALDAEAKQVLGDRLHRDGHGITRIRGEVPLAELVGARVVRLPRLRGRFGHVSDRKHRIF